VGPGPVAVDPKAAPPDVRPAPAGTAFDRLGGEAGMARITDDFFAKMLPDPAVDFSRGGRGIPRPASPPPRRRDRCRAN
jgi:hypothetical protein